MEGLGVLSHEDLGELLLALVMFFLKGVGSAVALSVCSKPDLGFGVQGVGFRVQSL